MVEKLVPGTDFERKRKIKGNYEEVVDTLT